MAARVNTRFVLILSFSIFSIVGLVGGLWVLKIRGDATRNIRAGDQLMAQGDYSLAVQMYGRAVNKEPGSLDHLRKMEKAILRVRPSTQGDVEELYARRVGVLRHRVRYRGQDAEVHLSLLRELHRAARFVNRAVLWQELANVAEEMWEQVPASDPKRIHARLYRGMANSHMMTPRSETDTGIRELSSDLESFVDSVPRDDLGWAALAWSQLSIALHLELDGQTSQALTWFSRLEETLDRAEAPDAAPDGPEIARIAAGYFATRYLADPESVDPDEMRAAIDRMVQLVPRSTEPQLLPQVVEILRQVNDAQGASRGIRLLEQFLEENPESHYHRMLLAELYFRNDDLEAAHGASEEIVAARPVPVSLLSRIQHRLRIRAASLIVDIQYQRWERAEDAEKNAQRRAIEDARTDLASLMVDPEREPLWLRAEGKLAYIKRDYRTAAARFEQIVKLQGTGDFETLWYGSSALEELGELGLALERLDAAIKQRPRQVPLLVAKIRLQAKMGRFADAQETLDRAKAIAPDHESLGELTSLIQLRIPGSGPEPADPLTRARAAAQKAFDEGDVETARATLLSQLKERPDHVGLLIQLMAVELRDGRSEQARAYVDRAVASNPENWILRRYQVRLQQDDRTEVMKQYLADRYDDEVDRTVFTAIQLSRMAGPHVEAAERERAAGNEQAASDAEARAARFREEAEGFMAEAKQLAPDHPSLLEYLFSEAIAQEDWEATSQLVQRASAVNADQAHGLIFKGRDELVRAEFEQAVQTLDEATTYVRYSSAVWRLMGVAHEELGNYNEAKRAYEEAYRCNPNDWMALRRYARLLVQMDEKVRALRILRTARQAIPNDETLQEMWLQLEADAGDRALAIRVRRQILRRSPDYRRNAMQLAAILGRFKPSFEHVRDDEGRSRYGAMQWQALPEVTREQLLQEVRSEWIQESNEVLQNLAAAQDTLDVASLGAQILRSRGEIDGGEQALREFCDRHRDTDVALEALILLGQYQSSIGRLNEGIATIESARALQSGDREADRALAGLLAANGRVEQALQLCVQMLESGSDLGIQLLAVDCHTRLQQFDEAGAVLRKVIDAEGSSVTTAMLLASMAFGQGDRAYAQEKFDEAERRYAEGREALAQAQQMEPSNPLPLVQLARSLLGAFGRTRELSALDEGLLALARADEAQGSAESISMVRAELLSAQGDLRGAVGELNRLLERFPGNDAARRRLLFLYEATRDLDGAMAVVVAGIERNPSLAYWHEQLGDVHVRQRDLESAAASFAKAQELESSLNRVYKLAQASLALEEPDFAAIVEALEAYADSLENRPGVRTVYAHALGGVKRRDEAIAQLRIAYAEYRQRIENNPSRPHYRGRWFGTVVSLFPTERVRGIEPFLRELAGDDLDPFELDWLAGVWAGEGAEGMTRAIELQRQAVGRCPEDDQPLRAQLLFKLGQFILATGDVRTAVGTFEEVIGINADHATALNNAAYIYAELLDEPAKAVLYAEQAAAVTPSDPNVLDTLGWAYFKVGRNDEAEDALRKSITAEPSAENHLHLAHVLANADRLQSAENYLRRAAELDPNAETSAKIDRLADEIAPRLGNRGSQ